MHAVCSDQCGNKLADADVNGVPLKHCTMYRVNLQVRVTKQHETLSSEPPGDGNLEADFIYQAVILGIFTGEEDFRVG